MTPLTEWQQRLSTQTPAALAQQAFTRANTNASRNVYLSLNQQHTMIEAEALEHRFPQTAPRPPLYGIPVAVKDCFAVAGYPTTCGSRFYAEEMGVAPVDSAVAAKLRAAGAVIMGKTHLHQLAYGITGENQDYGDCLQPNNPAKLTGGSSSGSAASVQEGSALAAIGTDTGGSIRVPAALCGLSGYRSSLGLGGKAIWQGGTHLAPSFDTLGWLFRDLRDGPVLAAALLDVQPVAAPQAVTIAVVSENYLFDAEPAVVAMYHGWQSSLRSSGATLSHWEPDFWNGTTDIFIGIQAHEAAALHRGNFQHFEPAIAGRLTWGASLSCQDLVHLRSRHETFRDQMDRLLTEYDFLMLPCAPMSDLIAGADHAETRVKILRYTTPASLAGMPAVTLSAPGGGVQLIAARGQDAKLLAFAASLAELATS